MKKILKKIYNSVALGCSREYVRFLAALHRGLDGHNKNTNRNSLLLVAPLIALVAWFVFFVVFAPNTFPKGDIITVKENSSLISIAHELESSNIIRSAFWFRIIVTLKGDQHHMLSGDYYFKTSKNIFSIARIISTGAFGLDPIVVTIPEGVDTKDMAILFEKKLPRLDAHAFLEIAQAQEGYLFPDTYYFLPNVKPGDVVRSMRDNFDLHILEIQDDIDAFDKPLNDIVIMASIIEKEAWNKKDRRTISGALWNRININMPLQVDATFFFTHNKGTYGITLAELRDKKNLYNTYVHKGLPPTPIASPGLDALKAAVNPTTSEYLFYLADRKGNTYFSKTYAEHLRKKRKYID